MAPSLLALLLLLKADGGSGSCSSWATARGPQSPVPGGLDQGAADGGSALPKFGVAAGNAEVFGGIWELRQFPALWLWLQFVMVVAAATNVPSDALRHLSGLRHWESRGVN